MNMNQEINVFELPTHEDAEIFDMWSDERLDNLATDIQENGFDPRYPLTVSEIDGQWILIDGRNRREACRRIDFNPPVYISTIDPKLAIARSNLQNHDQTQGQKAMRWAMLYPGSGKKGGDRKSNISNIFDADPEGVSKVYVAKARYVWHKNPKIDGENHPRLAKDVAAGLLTLTEAYELTQADVKRREEEEAIRQANAEKLNNVRARYPNLAALVDDERLSLAQAIASAEQSDRETEERERLERESIARQATFEKQVEAIRQSAPDLADKMVSGGLSFDAAIRMIEERKANDKAKRDANLEAFYRLCEIAPTFTSKNGVEYFTQLLIERGEEYRDRWRRSVKESLSNLKSLIDNRDEILRMINKLSK